jgi:hypothetical protein
MDSTVSFIAGSVHLRDQLKDYQFRGDALESMCLLEFVIETYEGMLLPNTTQVDNANNQDPNEGSRVGRPRSVRVAYREEAAKPKMCRVIRGRGHETVPRIVGKWFSRSDDPGCHDIYCASMLMLLKPWRSIRELKQHGETFEEKWDVHYTALSNEHKTVVDNIQYFHEAADSARDSRLSETETSENAEGWEFDFDKAEGGEYTDDENEDHADVIITEADIERARANKISMREQLFSETGVQIATDLGFFPETEEEIIPTVPTVRNADENELTIFNEWAKQLQDATRKIYSENGTINIASSPDMTEAGIIPLTESMPPSQESISGDIPPSIEEIPQETEASARPKFDMLNSAQQRAHGIISHTLRAELAGGKSLTFRNRCYTYHNVDAQKIPAN